MMLWVRFGGVDQPRNKEAHRGFWRELVPVYDVFERERRLPGIRVEGGKYLVR